MLKPSQDWDDAFSNGAYIKGSESLPQIWTDRAKVYRVSGVKINIDIPFGPQPREKMDIVWPDGTPKGLVVFIHGGYWMQLDKSYWTDLAEGARANGWAVCIPGYTLAPDVRICEITRQIGRAITAAAHLVSGPIRITGHSAGGHLSTRMICDDTPLPTHILERIACIQSISGLHDLRPLLHTKMNDVLGLDEDEARLESAVLHRPARAVSYCAWVGGNERPEFIRQSRMIAQVWGGLDIQAKLVVDGQLNHFNVLDGLRQRDSDITLNLLGKT